MTFQDLVISISPDINLGPLDALEAKLQVIASHLDAIGDKLMKTAAIPQLFQGGFAAVFAIEEKKIAQTAALMGKHIDHVKDTYMKAISDMSASSGMSRSVSWEGVRQAHRGGISGSNEQIEMTAKATKLQASGFGKTTEIISAATTAAVAANVEPVKAVDLFAKGVQSGEGAGAAEFAPGFKTLAGISGTSKVPFEDLWAALVGLSTTDKNTTRATTKLRSFVRDIFNIERMDSKREALAEMSLETFGDSQAVTQKKLVDMARTDGGLGKVLETINKLSGGGNLDKLLRILTAEGAQLPGLLNRSLFEQKKFAISNYDGVSEKIYESTAGQTLHNSFARLTQSINALSNDIGKNLTPVIKTLMGPVEKTAEGFRSLGGGVIGTFATALAAVTAATFAVGAAFKGVAFLMSNWGVAALGAGAAAFTESGSEWVKGKASRTFDWARKSQSARGEDGERNVKFLDSMKKMAEKIGKFDPSIAWEGAKKLAGGAYTIASFAVVSGALAAKDILLALMGGLTRFVTSGAGNMAKNIFSSIFGEKGIFSKFTDQMSQKGGALSAMFSIFTDNKITKGIVGITASLGALAARLLASPVGMAASGIYAGYSLIEKAVQRHDNRQEIELKKMKKIENLHGSKIGGKKWKKLKGDSLLSSMPEDFFPKYEITEEGKENYVKKISGKSGRDASDFMILDKDGYRELDISETEKYISKKDIGAEVEFFSLAQHRINESKKKSRKFFGDIKSAIGQGADERNALDAIAMGFKYKDGAWEKITGYEDNDGNLEAIRLNEFQMQNAIRSERGLNPMGFFAEWMTDFDRSSPSSIGYDGSVSKKSLSLHRFQEGRKILGESTEPLSGWGKVWESLKYIGRSVNPITGIPEAFRFSTSEMAGVPLWKKSTISHLHRSGRQEMAHYIAQGGIAPSNAVGTEDIDQILYSKISSGLQGLGEIGLEAFNMGERKDHMAHLMSKSGIMSNLGLMTYGYSRWGQNLSHGRSLLKGSLAGLAGSVAYDLVTDEDGNYTGWNEDAAENLAVAGATAGGLYFAGRRLWRQDGGFMNNLNQRVSKDFSINTGSDGKYEHGSRSGDPRGAMGKQPFKSKWGAKLGRIALGIGKFAMRGALGPIGVGLLAIELLTSQAGKIVLDGLKWAFDELIGKMKEWLAKHFPSLANKLDDGKSDPKDENGMPTTHAGWVKRSNEFRKKAKELNERIEKGDVSGVSAMHELSYYIQQRDEALVKAKEVREPSSTGIHPNIASILFPEGINTNLPVAPHDAAKTFANGNTSKNEGDLESTGKALQEGNIQINMHGQIIINESKDPDGSFQKIVDAMIEGASNASQSKDVGR